VEVRTVDDDNVWSTWEDAVKNQGLAEKSAREAGFEVGGMCTGHAVVCALEYVHERSDLLASYLHKAVTGGYSGGMNLEEAMIFARFHGVMALPKGQTVKHGSGNPWPNGPKYKFKDFLNVFDSYVGHRDDSYYYQTGHLMLPGNIRSMIRQEKDHWSKAIKHVLKTYNHPVVVGIHSGYEGHGDLAPFIKYRGRIDTDRPGKNNKIEVEDIFLADGTIDGIPVYRRPWIKDLKKTYHAIVIYGYKKSTQRFLVKNSWGPGGEKSKKGLCTLPFDYFDHFTTDAFVGLGHDNWNGPGIYGNDTGPKIAQHECASLPYLLPCLRDKLSPYEENNLKKLIEEALNGL
jgi:hypothetical protein